MGLVASGVNSDVDNLFAIVYNPPHARPNSPSPIKMIPSVLFITVSFSTRYGHPARYFKTLQSARLFWILPATFSTWPSWPGQGCS